MYRAFWKIVKRDLQLQKRRGADALTAVMFFVLACSLFPLALGPSPEDLAWVAGSIIWVALLLAVILSLDPLLRVDFEDGTLEQWLLSSYPLSLLLAARVLSHGIWVGIPLWCMATVVAVLLQLPDKAIGTLMLSLALGIPCLSLIGLMGVSLTLGLRQGGLLLALLLLPLYIPVLIFGAGAVNQSLEGLPIQGHLALLAALLLLAIPLAPWVAARSLRFSIQ